jgi:nitronate monooxygenase
LAPVALRTSLCDLLGIDVPIVQAPVSDVPALTAAVSNAGGLGVLPLSWLEPEQARAAIRETRRLTDRPFGVNLVLEWQQHERLAVALEEGVAVVSLFWGEPAPYTTAIREGGARCIVAVGSAAEARRAVSAGADAVVAQGWEAGGHVWGEVSTLALVPAVVDAISPVPVVAAGGISDGRGLAAALSLGAAGAWVGTRFVASEEAGLHPLYKQLVCEAVETDTVHSSLFDVGWPQAPHRTLRNSTMRLWEQSGSAPSGVRPGEGEPVAERMDGTPVPRYSVDDPTSAMTGQLEALALYAGQGVALVHDVLPAGEIVTRMAADALRVLAGLAAGQ